MPSSWSHEYIGGVLLAASCRGLRLARTIASQKAMKDLITKEIPDPEISKQLNPDSDEYLAGACAVLCRPRSVVTC